MVAYRSDLKEGFLVDDKYRIVKSIGSGSYGDVFYVKDARMTPYAMKVLRLFDVDPSLRDDMIRRFRQEYETAQTSGKYFIHSFDYSEIEGNPYFTMEYCPNGNLLDYVGSNTSLIPQLTYDILVGLYDLHSKGMIHRDIKPENILVRNSGHAALTDFGAVGNVNPKKRKSVRDIFGRPKLRFGSPLYMAPEMVDCKGGGVTYLFTVDIFSLGVMLYELLTGGRFPFGNYEDNKYRRLTQDEFLEQYRANAKKELWDSETLYRKPNGRTWLPIIERCLKAKYRDRYQNVLEIIEDLRPLISTSPIPVVTIDRSPNISKLVITQGEDVGKEFQLKEFVNGKKRMVRVGRNRANDIVMEDNNFSYVSRHHFTLEYLPNRKCWLIRDGQWSKEKQRWMSSTNGTFLNAIRASIEGESVFTGDIITFGEYKLKVE